MAEFILATVSLAVAVPSIALSFFECGKKIKEIADKFKNASSPKSAVRDIGAFGVNLYRGKLRVNLEIAEWAFLQDDIHPDIKDGLEDCLDALKVALVGAAATLESCFDKKGQLKRTHFAFRGERRAARSLEDLRKWQQTFDGIVDEIDKKRRLVPNNLALGRNRLQVIHKPDGPDYVPILGSCHSIAECEFNDNGIHTINVLIEGMTMLQELDPEERVDVVSSLASRLCTNRANQGVLRCLGYREKKTPELVFELPKELRTVQTLATTMTVPQNMTAGNYPLTHWSMLRKDTDLSSRRGSDDWMEDLYRHPQRQGRQPEERYNMGHDIYSLGVLLLEICLWEPFVQPGKTPPVSQLFETRAQELGFVSSTDSDSIKKLTKP